MESEKFSVLISPEVLSSDLINLIYTASTTYELGQDECITSATTAIQNTQSIFVYSGMSYILSGGTNGDSLLTGLTMPILFTQTYNDIGFYSEFDGLMVQKDIVTNFLYSGNSTTNLNSVTLYNTSGDYTVSYLDFTTFYVDWGDNSPTQQLTSSSLTHTYLANNDYTITLSGSNPWGVTIIEKPITIPLQSVTIPNPNGNIVFVPQQGNWANIPLSYDYIYPLDSNNTIPYQISSNWTTTPFPISGFTNSKLMDLKRWGPVPYTVGYVFNKNNQVFGQINSITADFTGYTINNVDYYDLINGKTLYVVNSSGLTANDIVASAITKNEYLLDFVMAPEIQTDIYVERGKYSAFESLQRLGEVDNIGDMVRYGYGFFKINNA
jgi:hypothetical protein